MGVQLFFVLSGYLITGILLGMKVEGSAGPAFRRFYVRRFVRIVPAYYLTIAIFVIPYQGRASLWHFAYLTNVQAALEGSTAIFAGHFWSLAVEEQFYLVWPWVILTLSMVTIRRVTLALICVGPVFRFIWYVAFAGNVGYSCLPFGCSDFLSLGSLVAIYDLDRGHSSPGTQLPGANIIALGLAGVSILGQANGSGGAIAAAGGGFCWALAAVQLVLGASHGYQGWIGWALRTRPLRYLGRISYGVYLCHIFLPPLVWRLVPYSQVARLPGGPLAVDVGAAIAVASLSWAVLERPLNARRDRVVELVEGSLAAQVSQGETR
jgi:peptidoglycan/LPS O-acetylase OafA/YrhL